MLSSYRNQKKYKQNKIREVGPQLPLWAWKEIAFSINQEPYWYSTIRLQGLMWNKRGHKLIFVKEENGYEYWETTNKQWRMELRRDLRLIAQINFRNAWQYKSQEKWNIIGIWYDSPGEYRDKEKQFWFHWRIAMCSCKKERWDIRDFMVGKHRWDLCKSCIQGEIVRHTEPRSLQRLALLHIVRNHVFQIMPLWRARRVTVQRFPWSGTEGLYDTLVYTGLLGHGINI
ncbi:Q protein [Ovine lentivirus]|uniref:Virion infectivity factor n=1 Tax=Ovine maedi visna related virus (strain South Africa) TaxID=11664 RepID=VIF_OMVVS|nr:Q protein [Ovine lentivirus]P16902.1 RecName: Full=Virion infectivity factor; AltName: Full=Q protein [Ovine lentivirus (strain SA-OMVV)]pir/C46335/ vif protein - Maedi/Visna virus (strain SA-OMVV) [Visna-maedi virus]AAA46780.1 Q protein [Ovine lentivirus]AAA66813.1 Q protein [Ovine lentivirus]